MEFLLYPFILSIAIYLYFLNSKKSLIAVFIISVSLTIFSLYRIRSLRNDFINQVFNLSKDNVSANYSYLIDFFNYSIISIFILILILILLSNIFLLNNRSVSILYITTIGIIMVAIPIYTYIYATSFNIYNLNIANYLFRCSSYQTIFLHIPFTLKKIFNYFKYTKPFFSYSEPIVIR